MMKSKKEKRDSFSHEKDKKSELLEFSENLKKYDIGDLKVTDTKIFQTKNAEKKGENQVFSSNNNRTKGRKGSHCSEQEVEFDRFVDKFYSYGTIGELYVTTFESDYKQVIQNKCTERLRSILNQIESRGMQDMLKSIASWNPLVRIQDNYTALSTAISDLNNNQMEKGLSKLKIHIQKWHHRHNNKATTSSNQNYFFVKISDSKKITLESLQVGLRDVSWTYGSDKERLRSIAKHHEHVKLVPPSVVNPSNTVLQNPSSRLYTYVDWPVKTHVWPQQLSNAGFYFTRAGTTVKCVTCGVSTSVESWPRNERPETIHFKLNNDCEFIKGNFPHINNSEQLRATENAHLQNESLGDLSNVEQHNHINASEYDATNINKFQSICNGMSEHHQVPDVIYENDHQTNGRGILPDVARQGYNQTSTRINTNQSCAEQSQVSREVDGSLLRSSVFSENSIKNDSGPTHVQESPALPNSPQTGIKISAYQNEKKDLSLTSGEDGVRQEPQIKQDTTTSQIKNGDCWKIGTDFPVTFPQEDSSPHFCLTDNHPLLYRENVGTNPEGSCRPQVGLTGNQSLLDHENIITVSEEASRPQRCPTGNRSLLDRGNVALINDTYNNSVTVDQPTSSLEHRQPVLEPEFSFPSYRNYQDRLATFSSWPASSYQPPAILAESGCFYTGKDDVVRCFCCNLGLAEWAASDDPWVEHARHNPKCWFLRNRRGQMFIDNVQEEWKTRYKPRHAAFDDLCSRLATFDGWRDDIEQTPDILANAGFFYTGEDDIVRCHFCDGGLRNWEPGDEPWEEHVRWFPDCKYVIKMKGCQFIKTIKEKYQHRETQEEVFNISEEPETARLLSTEAAKGLLEMDIPINSVKLAINRFIRSKGHSNFTINDLMDLVFKTPTIATNPATGSAASSTQERPLQDNREKDPEKLRAINTELKNNKLCVICKTNERCMLFVNCGHRLTCEQCCRSIDFCPHCDKRIKKVIKTFLS